MKTFNNSAAQGDILIIRLARLPEGAKKLEGENGKFIVAHSETGHHHTVQANNNQFYQSANDEMIMYLEINEGTPLIHNRSFDTHDPIMLKQGVYEVRRQREYTPKGWRRVAD